MPTQPPSPVVRPPSPNESALALAQLQQLARQRQPRAMTDDEIEAVGDDPGCMHCGGYHARTCPRVRLIEWHLNGTMAKVEYWPFDQIDWTGVMFHDVSPATSDPVQSVHGQPHPRPRADAPRRVPGGRPGRPGFE